MEEGNSKKDWFGAVARATEKIIGSKYFFAFAVALIIGWVSAGPYFQWSDSHSLFINTATTIISFIAIILVQHTQNINAIALHAKLDELIIAVQGARNQMVGLEDRTQKEIEEAKSEILQEATQDLNQEQLDELQEKG
jgi:low affinity Fe/Cu permease